MQQNVGVNFTASGNDLLSFMDTVRDKARESTRELIEDARKQSDNSREQMRIIEEQIKLIDLRNKAEAEGAKRIAFERKNSNIDTAWNDYESRVGKAEDSYATGKISEAVRDKKISRAEADLKDKEKLAGTQYADELKLLRENERQQALQIRLMREQIDTVRVTARENLSEMRDGNSAIVEQLDDPDADPISRLAAQIALENKDKEDASAPKEKGWKEVGGSLFTIDMLNRLNQSMSALSSTQNGFDMIAPASSMAGQILGGLLGGVGGAMVAGPTGALMGAGVGSSIGGMFGSTYGEFQQRRAVSAQDFLSAKNKYTATTQMGIGEVPEMSSIGVSAAEYLEQLKQTAVAMGTTARAMETTSDILEVQKGAGVEQGTLGQFLTLFRGTQKDISNLVAGVMSKGKSQYFGGGDFTFLNELMSKMGQMQMQFMGNQASVSTGTVLDIMSRFDKVGGMFATKDFRSSGLIGQINNALVNPQSDSLKAMAFQGLQGKGRGIAGTIEEMQKGLASPEYLKTVLQNIERMGGGDDFQIMNIAGAFGLQNNIAAARRIHKNKKALMSGSISQSQLEDEYSSSFLGNFGEAAKQRTTPLEQNTAELRNGLLSAWYDSVGEMSEAFGVAMENAFKGATIQMNNGTIKFAPTAVTGPKNYREQKAEREKEKTKKVDEIKYESQASFR